MTGPSNVTRRTVLERARGRCEICCGKVGAIHHRRPRGAGGTSLSWVNQPANLVALCTDCHLAVESNRDAAMGAGLLLPYSAEDASAPVVLWRGLVYLDNHGGVTAAEKGAIA